MSRSSALLAGLAACLVGGLLLLVGSGSGRAHEARAAEVPDGRASHRLAVSATAWADAPSREAGDGSSRAVETATREALAAARAVGRSLGRAEGLRLGDPVGVRATLTEQPTARSRLRVAVSVQLTYRY